MFPVPKPVKREKKKPTGLRRTSMTPATYGEALAKQRKSQRRRRQHQKRLSAHARRPREWGRMAWLHSLRFCFVRAFFQQQWLVEDPDPDQAMAGVVQFRLIGLVSPCGGEFQCAHLFGRYNNGDRFTVLACRDHHMDVDQTRRWFLVLTKPERRWLKTFLAARATLAWEALPTEERARWHEIGEARFGRRRAA